MTSSEQRDDYDRWVQAHNAEVNAHFPPSTPEDFAFFAQLERELDAAPHIRDYFQQLEAPYPAPLLDTDVQNVVGRAIEDLAEDRRMAWLGDGPIQVHLIASLIGELQARLDEAIVLAADQETDIADIARLAGLSSDQTRQTITNTDPENDLAN